MASEYQYKPLAMDQRQIRLVQLLPGKTHPISIKLLVCDLTAVAFDALSYVWGDMTRKIPLECEGSIIWVGNNLASYLQSLLEYPNIRPLWIDAISIHQNNASEWNYSMPLMPLIFQTARRTLCWTGSELTCALREFTSATLEVGGYQAKLAEYFSGVDVLLSTYKIVEDDLEVFGKAAEKIDTNTWRKVDAFLDTAYFKRYA